MNDLRDRAISLGLFDQNWYCDNYPDVLLSGIEPFEHYLAYGWYLGRPPSANFKRESIDWSLYEGSLDQHPWVAFISDMSGYLDAFDEFEGSVDFISGARVTGWAWCPLAPEYAVRVEALIDNKVIGRARADLARPDLLLAGKGSGRYGFTIKFEPRLPCHKIPTIRVAHRNSKVLSWTVKLPDAAASEGGLVEPTVDNLTKDHSYFTQPSPEYEDRQSGILDTLPKKHRSLLPMVIAYYLPQFHQIAENDDNWGTGFTDWRQLSRALPRFPGHYQPRIPRDLGFYTLGGDDVLKRQATMALDAGVSAFCYYYYWFNGTRVLERPLEAHLKSNVEMPFLLMWANENWTRTWDGFEDNVLLRQDYHIHEEDALLADFARHFNDPRYLRLNDRPLFIIYNPSSIPNAKVTIKRWRQKLLENFGQKPLLFMAQAFGLENPKPYGLDGAIEFPPHKLAASHPGRAMLDAYSSDFSGRVVDYGDIVASSLQEADAPFPLVKTAVPSWDNDARRPNRSLILEGISPARYEAWLSLLIERAIAKPVYGRPVVAINAWNEWAEGAYLEPDVHYGAAYLNATARAVKSGIARYLAATGAPRRT